MLGLADTLAIFRWSHLAAGDGVGGTLARCLELCAGWHGEVDVVAALGCQESGD